MNPPETGPPRAAAGLLAMLLAAGVPGAALASGNPAFDEAYARGNASLRAGDHDTAATAFRAAADADPRSTDARLKLGMTLSRKRDHAGAEQAYRAVLELDPAHAQALNNLGNVFLRQDRYEEAGRYYAQALAVKPDYLLALFHHAWIQRQLNRPEEAAAGFERCLELEPQSDRDRIKQLDCRFYLGTLRFRERDHEAAAALMQDVLKVHPRHVEARYYLGMAYRGLGRMDEAREQLAIHRRALDGKRRTAPIEKPID